MPEGYAVAQTGKLCVPGRKTCGMDNARKPSKQQLIRRSARIREHAADPTAHGTPAWKVDQLLHDGDLSAMSVLDVIDYESRRL